MKVLGRHIRQAGQIDNSTSPSGRRLAPRVYLYDQIIDLMLSNPGITLTAIGQTLGKSPAWLSFTIHTDAFKDLFNQRRLEKNAKVSDELTQQLQRVAMKGLTVLEERIDTNPKAIPTAMALELADKSLERLGYGVKLPGVSPSAVLINNSITVSAEDFALSQRIVRQVEMESPRAEGPAQVSVPAVRPSAPSISDLLDAMDDERSEES